jgi:hypothetical protein
MRCWVAITFLTAAILFCTTVAPPSVAVASGGATAVRSDDPKPSRDREIREIKLEIRRLEKRVEQLEGENRELRTSNRQLQGQSTQTTQRVKALQTKVEAVPSASQFSDAFGHYLGSHTFTVTGAAGVDFIYNQQSGALDDIPHATQNTFLLDWEPMILYRPADWILFEGVFSGAFGQTGTGMDLSTAEFQLFPNDYTTIVAGLFDNPFGDWLEAQSPMWVNRFVSAPLPFGVESVVPPGEIGVQLRGGYQWGELGQDVDYTIWAGNGPQFSENVPGASLSGPVAVASSQTNGKSISGRFRIYPIPVDSNMGRLELGASSYNGKWLDGQWFNSWGVDFNYFMGNFQTRGEWLESYRHMGSGLPIDHRQGWYLQIGYMLDSVTLPFLSDQLNQYIQRLQPLVRYSGVNQHAVAIDDITGATGMNVGGVQAGLIPDFGLGGSPALYAPHSREVALALDYWIAPSIVWENEFDFELPHAGGIFVAGDGSSTPVGSVPNDRAFLTQFTIGF